MQATKRNVLIVEDEFVLYEQLSEFFEEKGYNIIGHNNGKAVDNYDDAVQLLKNNEPHIAVLDIGIKGKKDGLELAAYIKEHFYSLIIILTARNNHENIERARMLNPDGFVLKINKPVDKKQLWASVSVKLPKLYDGDLRKTQGTFFKVREVDIRKANEKKETKAAADPLDIETFIKWENIAYIESYNSKMAGEGNNNVLIHIMPGNTGYIHRAALSEMEKQLPVHFARFDQANIVNVKHLTGKGRGERLYLMGDVVFKISDTYKEAALEKMKLFLG